MKDLHEALDVTVYDEDRDKKVEFLGRVLIPLLKVNICSYTREVLALDVPESAFLIRFYPLSVSD